MWHLRIMLSAHERVKKNKSHLAFNFALYVSASKINGERRRILARRAASRRSISHGRAIWTTNDSRRHSLQSGCYRGGVLINLDEGSEALLSANWGESKPLWKLASVDGIQELLKKQFTLNYHISQPLPPSGLLPQQDIKRKQAKINKSPSNN